MFSGVTVAIAMAGMFFAGASTFTSFAIGTITVVAIAVAGSLTVLPAVLSKLGDPVNQGRIPFLIPPRARGPATRGSGRRSSTGPAQAGGRGDRRHRGAPRAGEPGAEPQAGRPGLRVASAGHRRWSEPTTGSRRRSPATDPGRGRRRARRRLQCRLTIGVHTCASGWRRSDVVEPPVTVEFNSDHTSRWSTCRSLATGPTTPRTRRSPSCATRSSPRPSGSSRAEANVTGYTAGSKDFNDLMESRVPLVFAFVLGSRSSCCCWSPSARS